MLRHSSEIYYIILKSLIMKEFLLRHFVNNLIGQLFPLQKMAMNSSKRVHRKVKNGLNGTKRRVGSLLCNVRRISNRYRVISFISANI